MGSDGSPALRFPDFLIIGAMKAGTTTLYRDLILNRAIYFPVDKEPDQLGSDLVLSAMGRRRYASLYRRAKPEQLCGDGSTTYAKLPDVLGVPARTERILGRDVRIIYVVRNPVDRAISHYRHLVAHHGLTVGCEEAIEKMPAILAYSRYAYQLRPWLDRFGSGRICVLKFEDYVRERRATVRVVCRFLGVPPEVDAIDESRGFNATSGVPVLRGGWRRVRNARPYRTFIRRHLSLDTRERLRRLFLPTVEVAAPLDDTYLRARLAHLLRMDAEEFGNMLGWTNPIWADLCASARDASS